MRIAIVGAGAIGGWLAARLATGDYEPNVLLRPGQRLPALEIEENGRSETVQLNASDQPEALGEQDIVLLAVKAYALVDAAHAARTLIGPHTTIVPVVNGVPWWFADPPLESVDPGGSIARSLPRSQVLGSVVHAAALRERSDRVVVEHVDRLIFGEPEGHASVRASTLADLFAAVGITAKASTSIRRDIWYKAWGNMTMNPLSALTGATADRIIADCRPLILACMEEARQIGAAIGCPINESGEDRIAVTQRLGAFRTSMLQDLEAGRKIELEALLGAPLELARRHGVAAPNLSNLYAITRLMGQSRGLL